MPPKTQSRPTPAPTGSSSPAKPKTSTSASTGIPSSSAAAQPSVPATQANATPPLGPQDILKFANGQLDLVKGYEYNEEQIMAFLHDVAVNCSKYLGTQSPSNMVATQLKQVANAIKVFILTSNNTKTTLVMGKDYTETRDEVDDATSEEARKAALKKREKATNKIEKAAKAQSTGPKTVDSRPQDINSDRDNPDVPDVKWSTIGAPLAKFPQTRTLPFEGVPLPMSTIFDYLAWLFSILGSADKAGADRNESNFYLPVLALFSRWCTVISSSLKSDALPMVHISWWDTRILFGVTLGEFPNDKDKDAVVAARRAMLTAAQYQQPPPEGARGKQNFGKCAETNLFIVAKGLKLDSKSVRGLAIVPVGVENLPINKLIAELKDKRPPEAGTLPSIESSGISASVPGTNGDRSVTAPKAASASRTEASPPQPELEGDAKVWADKYKNLRQYQSAAVRLADPCEQSCQVLFREGLGWDWTEGFQVDDLKEAHGMPEWKMDPKSNADTIGLAGAGTGPDAWKPTRAEKDRLNNQSQVSPQEAIGNTLGTILQPATEAGGRAILSGLLKPDQKTSIQGWRDKVAAGGK